MRFLIRLVITAAALWAATRLITGISYEGGWLGLLGVALVFGVLNAIVRPVLKFFTFPLFLITLGLFTFVLNAFMLWLASPVAAAFGLRFRVRGGILGRAGGRHRELPSLAAGSGSRDRVGGQRNAAMSTGMPPFDVCASRRHSTPMSLPNARSASITTARHSTPRPWSRRPSAV